MTPSEIRFYRAVGEYGFLSNLWRSPVTFDGRQFYCAEAAYQFGKPRDEKVAEWIVSAPKPHLMAVAAHGLFVFDVRADWNEVKVGRMRAVLAAKFEQNHDARRMLLDTRDAALVEDSKMDAFWGTGRKGSGKNMLGQLLVELRGELRKAGSV